MQAELVRALTDGPGIVVFKQRLRRPGRGRPRDGGVPGSIDAEKAAGAAGGRPLRQARRQRPGLGCAGQAGRRRPEVFADYYANDVLALVSEAWLGPDYQVTSQVNVVNPGGQAQVAHRDYHLGFMDARSRGPLPGPGPPALARRSPCRARSRTATCPSRPARRSTCPTRSSTSPATSPSTSRSSRSTSRSTTSSCRWRRATPRSSTPPCSTAPARTVSTDVTPDGQPAAGVLRVRPRHGDRRPGRDVPGRVPGAAGEEGGRRVRQATWTTSSPPSAEGYAFPTNLDRDQPIDGLAPQTPGRPGPPGRRRGLDPGSVRDRPGRPGGAHPRRARLSHRGCPRSCWPPAGPTRGTRCRWPVTG